MTVSRFPTWLTADQCRQARILLRWQIIELADRAGVTVEAVARFEAGEGGAPLARSLREIFDAQCVGFASPDGRLTLDGVFYNSRADNGTPTYFELDWPRPVDPVFRHPPLPGR